MNRFMMVTGIILCVITLGYLGVTSKKPLLIYAAGFACGVATTSVFSKG